MSCAKMLLIILWGEDKVMTSYKVMVHWYVCRRRECYQIFGFKRGHKVLSWLLYYIIYHFNTLSSHQVKRTRFDNNPIKEKKRLKKIVKKNNVHTLMQFL